MFDSVQDISHPKQQHPTWSIDWERPGLVHLLLNDGTIVEAESPYATFIVTISVAPLRAVTSRVYEEEGRVIAAEASIEIDNGGFKAIVLCRLVYDQASGTWLVTTNQAGGQSKWTPPPGPVRVPGPTLKTTFEATQERAKEQ